MLMPAGAPPPHTHTMTLIVGNKIEKKLKAHENTESPSFFFSENSLRKSWLRDMLVGSLSSGEHLMLLSRKVFFLLVGVSK